MNHFRPNNRISRRPRAFTLIEILIVVALTAVLFALMLVPLVNALNYTRNSQLLTAAQDAARITRETITRELGSALYVFDNTSHPFLIANDPKVAGEDRYTNFLDLQILNKAGQQVVAHAYYAKLDFLQPKINDIGTPIDPTTGEPIAYSPSKNGSAIITNPSLIFPAAAGTTMTRYWVGLKDPTKSYNNTREGTTYNNSSDDNTYVLYRAQFQPYIAVKDNNGNVTGSKANTELFATRPKLDASGNVVTDANGNPVLIPELDDPDFFRYVNQNNQTDVNWLDDTHGSFPTQDALGVTGTPGSAAQHNNRVENWIKIAKAVIPGPTVDLILLPHFSNGKLNYDQSGQFNGIAHSGVAHDPVPANGGKDYPIVNTSVTFRPGTVSGNATPATTSEYNSQGVVSGTDQNGYAYVPTIYTTSNQSWVKPYSITLTPPTAPANSGQKSGGVIYTISQDPATGDYMEYAAPPSASPVAVFDVTNGLIQTDPATKASYASYIPLTVNADNGTINFDVPAQPDPTNAYSREWVYTPVSPTKDANGPYVVDLTTPDDNKHVPQIGTVVDYTYPLYAVDPNTDLPLHTARIVPGSLRVYGPDGMAGPGQGQTVLYTETGIGSESANDPQKGDNRYSVDYGLGVIHFQGNASQFTPVAPATTSPVQVKVIYNYQANMAPVGTINSNSKMSAGYVLQPMGVAVDYQTRDLITVNIGVRIFDISTGVPKVIPSVTKIKIGNSNR